MVRWIKKQIAIRNLFFYYCAERKENLAHLC